MHARTHAHARTRTHTHTHARAQALSGQHPFGSEHETFFSLYDAVIELSMPPDDLAASAECHAFLANALSKAAADRGTAHGLLSHAWLVHAAEAAGTAGTCALLKQWLDENGVRTQPASVDAERLAESIGLLRIGSDDS